MLTSGTLGQLASPQQFAAPSLRYMPRDHADFPALRQQLGLRAMANGGAVRPVMLREARRFRDGGLARAAENVRGAGRFEDSLVVHLNPDEFKEMAARHGPATINPVTKLPEFGFFHSLGKILKAVAPIAALAIPGIGAALAPALSAALGVSTTVATGLGSALAGGALGAATGGGKGALLGAVTGGLGGAFGGTASSALQGMGASANVANSIVNAGMGAGFGAAASQDPLKSALMTGALSYLAPGVTGSIQNAFAPSAASGAITSSALAPVASGATEAGAAGLSAPMVGSAGLAAPVTAAATGAAAPAAAGVLGAAAPAASAGILGGGTMQAVIPALLLASALSGGNSNAPPPAIPTPPPGWNSPLVKYDYSLQKNPAFSGLDLSHYGERANAEPYFLPSSTIPHAPAMAQGGALRMLAGGGPSAAAQAGSVRGPGGGKDDAIHGVSLSDNEHVWSAADVAALGDGSSDAGHRRMEALKQQVRKDAGQKSPQKPTPQQRKGALRLVADAKRKGK